VEKILPLGLEQLMV